VHHRFRVSWAGTIVALALVVAACGGDSGDDDPAPLPVGATTSVPAVTAAPEVTADDAMAIALEAVGGGQVVETDADEFEVVIQVWEITVVGPDGVRRQVSVDMTNGTVLGNEVDD
jgi:hypothetical protein